MKGRFVPFLAGVAAAVLCAAHLAEVRAATPRTAQSKGFKSKAVQSKAAESQAAIRALESWLALPAGQRPGLDTEPFARTPLATGDANRARHLLWADHLTELRVGRRPEWEAESLELEGRTMRFRRVVFGDPGFPPAGGRALFISLHGGGAVPPRVNDSQWTNQIALAKAYAPAEGVYVAPRAPTDAWDLWHQPHIDDFLDRLIEDALVLDNVNPDRVYLMGYSAGGDGVYQLAPRMADRWAAAAMMAGHPNDASPLSLRNVPFAVQVGAEDAAYHRNELAADWGRQMDALREADPAGYEHITDVHAGLGHWMKLADRKAVPWMEQFRRQSHPDRVVWRQDDVTHRRLYWLALPHEAEPRPKLTIDARRAGATFQIEASEPVRLLVRIDESMADADEPVTIKSAGRVLFAGPIPRTIGDLARTLNERGDPRTMFSGEIAVDIPGGGVVAQP